MTENDQKVVKMVQELLLAEEDNAVTPDLIQAKIEQILSIQPKWKANIQYEAIVDELIRRFSLWIGENTTLQDNTDHISWLNAARKKDWRYWQRYREYLERKLSPKAVDGINDSSDHILGLLEDPKREGTWDRRGLVVGHVQSGKTANYTGLICKAADAGYKIIIVLAGQHNNLRAQTQMRLDEGFLGYETKPTSENLTIIGVGEIDSDPTIKPNYVTNRSEKGDFNTRIANNLGITPEQRPWLFVVKKNKTVLERLYKWLQNHVADSQDPSTGRRIITGLPLLLIDDEADHASVDTGEQIFDADGKPDDEHQPTAINSRIRKILHTFTRSAYVGYTATPFANIFIHERGSTSAEGPDLFPSSFIINLAASSNYVGPAKVFGLRSNDGRDGGLPLIREIDDFVSPQNPQVGWMPIKHSKEHRPLFQGESILPPSLVEAIDLFILGCALRVLRGQGKEHSSMLVHVTRFNLVQDAVFRQIETHIRHMRQLISRKLGADETIQRLHTLWEHDVLPKSQLISEKEKDIVVASNYSWTQVLDVIPDVLYDIDVRKINGTAKDVLDYTENQATGLKVIAIGGDKLARGLTLEGLSVSYFLRASKMYDTLMQMGRWFGYRPGYLDICRLYTTSDLVEWFEHIADASEELREEFDLMAATGGTPRDYGLKVQSHPTLMITSRLKMRSAKDLMISFSGELLETVAFHRDKTTLKKNFDSLLTFVRIMGQPSEIDPSRERQDGDQRQTQKWNGFLWRDVSATDVIDFLQMYRTHPEVYKVRSDLLAEFIKSMNEVNELKKWSVALIGSRGGKSVIVSDSISIEMTKRSNKSSQEHKYSIGRLLSPRDESIDLSNVEWESALRQTREAWHADPGRSDSLEIKSMPMSPNGPAIRRIRQVGVSGISPPSDRGLLLLYLLDPLTTESPQSPLTQFINAFTPDTPPIAAFGIAFPGSKSGLERKVMYRVNSVEWKQWEQMYDVV